MLRLEKGHLIVGQDTDGLTQAFSAGLDWAVKLDKPDFAGAPELRWQHEEGPQTQLVSLQPVDPDVVPPEASQIVSASSEILGRVTSSRRSPTLGRGVCLAQLRSDQAVLRQHRPRAAARRPDRRGPSLQRAGPRRPGRSTSPCLRGLPSPAAR